ncbi:MAG: prolipoprotein diacylglyceryl transferase [Sandaracinaceae bacterium]|nr:prolipoprotein diacylglyceryl transferase [Sandaracinaceae bacterium]
MHPIFVELELFGHPIAIGSYGLCLAVALLAIAILSARSAHRLGCDWALALASVGYAMPIGLFSAMLLYWLIGGIQEGWNWKAIASRGVGLVFYGSIPGALIGSYLPARWFRLPWLRILEASIPAFAGAHAIGRIGCFLGGCCYGAPWNGPWAVRSTHSLAPMAHPSVWRHPVQIYESLGLIAIGFVFALVPQDEPRLGVIGSGRRIGSYAISYGVLRLVIEWWRGDAIRGVFWRWGLSTSQLISILVIFVGAWLWRRGSPSPSPRTH